MNPRLAKEFQPLLFPWFVAAIVSLISLIGLVSQGAFARFLMSLPAFAFFGGCLLLASLPFGSEFQHRTLPLLLAQPLDRSQLWREKFLAATTAVLALVAVFLGILIGLGEKISLNHFLPYLGFVVATVCSSSLCALKARSVIGGMAFSICSQFLVLAGVSGITYFCYKLIGRTPDKEEWQITVAYVVAGATYSAFTLWLGWKTFATMEVRDAPVSANLTLPGWMTPSKLSAVLRCRPAGDFRNLIRKEVCLQKPIATIAALFIVCWLLTLLLFVLQPSRSELWKGILNGMAVVHIVIVVLLAGCVSLSDDKALGTAAWHLTLPVSALRQWFIKLLVAAGTAVAMAVLLPTLLAALTLFKARVGLLSLRPEEALDMVIPCAVLFVLSFWSASLVANTTRAVLTMVSTALVLATTAALGFLSAEKLGGLQTGLLTTLSAKNQWSPYFLDGLVPINQIVLCLIVVAMLIALVQSFRQFRRAHIQRGTYFRCATILAFVTFAIAFWIRDLTVSLQRGTNSHPAAEVMGALHSISLSNSDLWRTNPPKLTVQDLEKTGLLSKKAQQWLRNSTIEAHRVESRSRQSADWLVYSVTIKLPNGDSFPCTWSIPKPKVQPEQEP